MKRPAAGAASLLFAATGVRVTASSTAVHLNERDVAAADGASAGAVRGYPSPHHTTAGIPASSPRSVEEHRHRLTEDVHHREVDDFDLADIVAVGGARTRRAKVAKGHYVGKGRAGGRGWRKRIKGSDGGSDDSSVSKSSKSNKSSKGNKSSKSSKGSKGESSSGSSGGGTGKMTKNSKGSSSNGKPKKSSSSSREGNPTFRAIR